MKEEVMVIGVGRNVVEHQEEICWNTHFTF